MSGPNSAYAGKAFAYSSLRRLQTGDLVLLHCISCIDGYWRDISVEGFGGIRHCDLVTVTQSGVDVLTPFHSSVSELTLS